MESCDKRIKRIKTAILKILNSKAEFDHVLLIWATDNHIITPQLDYLENFKSLVRSGIEGQKNRLRMSNAGFESFKALKHIINYCYKYYPSQVFDILEEFYGIDDFCDFLIKPESFEMVNFNSDWLKNVFSFQVALHKILYKHPNIRQSLYKVMKRSKNEFINDNLLAILMLNLDS